MPTKIEGLIATVTAKANDMPTFTPKERLGIKLKAMKDVVDGAKEEGRDLTAEEIAALEDGNDQVDELREQIERGEKSKGLMDRIAGKGRAEDADGNPIAGGTSEAWARKAMDELRGVTKGIGEFGKKSLVTGTVSVPSLVSTVTIDAKPTTVLDLIASVTATGHSEGNSFSYMRQTKRINNAAAVPDFAPKPKSDYEFDQAEDTFRTYQNQTDDLPWRYLDDFSGLIDIVRVQLAEDTREAIERDLIGGDGTNDKFTGILNTSGVQTQAFSTDLITTLSAAKYKLLGQSRNLNGWVLNPTDLQKLELLRENGATGGFLFKSRAEIEGFLGAPVATSLGLPAGTALAADWSQAELLPYGDDELVLDSGKRTTNNTFLLMYEGRYGFRVKKPFDFVKVTLAGA